MAGRVTDIERARDAARQGLWSEAYEQFRKLDQSRLTPEDLEALADSLWWLSRLDESITARLKAYSSYVAEGDNRRAGYIAWFVSYDYLSKGEPSVATGWVRRARRHLTSEPECIERGYLAITEADEAQGRGDFEQARTLADQSIELGQRLNSPDLVAMGIQTLGRIHIAQGKVREGAELLDEAMSSVVAEELSPFFTGWIYCNVLAACLEITDLRRAGEWAEEARVWCESIPAATPFHGLCRLYRVQVVSLLGAWTEAEAEARRASDELVNFDSYAAAEALYAVGEIRRRMGDLAAAEDAFTRAHQLGRDPQPGLALVRLAQGKNDAAAAALRLSLADDSGSRPGRVSLLAAQVEVALAAGDLDLARAANSELEAIASESLNPMFQATAAMAHGALRLAEDDVTGALSSLRRAWKAWNDLRLPYEAARARMLLGAVARRGGDEERAQLELLAAQAEFERLGASLDARTVAELLGEPRLPGGLTAREAQVLRLVAAGRTNREIGAELFISEHTVARHLSNILTKLDLSSRVAATAYAVEHGLA